MPLSALVRQLQQVPLTGEVAARMERSERLRLSGAGRGARALIASALAAQEMVGGLRAASDGLGQGAVFTLSLPAADVERQNPSTRSDA